MEQTKTLTKEEKKQSALREFVEMILYVLTVFAVCFFIITFVGQRSRVSGHSMESTLSDGDNLIVDKLSYRFHDPERFDIVIFPVIVDGEESKYIKRIIGLPGETVWINTNGEIYINGVLLQEDYGREIISNPGDAITPITLGTDEYFVLGDNRNQSTDSRFSIVGAVKREDIIGKAWMRIFPFSKIQMIKHQ